MKLQTRLYVTTQGCTDAATTRSLAYELADPLDALHGRKLISGYQALVLKSEDDYEEHELDRALIERETRGRLPAIFLNITCHVDTASHGAATIEPLIAKYGFRHLLTECDGR